MKRLLHSAAVVIFLPFLTLTVPARSQSNSENSQDIITEAKAVIQLHEEYAMANDLNAVMTNIANDIVMLASGLPLIEGKNAFRDFYGDILASGRLEFGHDYSGGEVLGGAVVLHGVSRGTVTSEAGEVTSFANNFIHVLRRGADGKLKIWRASFAPSK